MTPQTGEVSAISNGGHTEGLFSREEWLSLLRRSGFNSRIEAFSHSDVERPIEVFLASKV